MAVPPEPGEQVTLAEVRDIWRLLSLAERVEAFTVLAKADREDLFLALSAHDMAELFLALPADERRALMRLLPPDDAADLIQHAPAGQSEYLLGLLDEPTRNEVVGLLAYARDVAGGLMNPRYVRMRAEMTVDEAFAYLRAQARAQLESIYYVYVVDEAQHLVGVVSVKQLLAARPEKHVRDVMRTEVVCVDESAPQTNVARLFAHHDLIAIPVVDAEGCMKGIVTVDDVVDVVREEATKDIQKLGGTEALGAPYLQIAFGRMVKKRGGWLAALFIGEMLTATAMAFFEDEIARAVVLALFVPLIISSGGNSGSQASTLVIRAMALGEVRLRDAWRVIRRELGTGLALGTMLGAIGFVRIVLWQAITPVYGEHYLLIAATVFGSLIGVVTFGTLAGSLLPFVLRRLGFDPASACAPFVATLVDVTGLLIYFGTATLLLTGTLL
jgi:magnesium transporter